MPQPDFDFLAGFWKALLGEDGARELAQHFLDMGPEARAELDIFHGRDPAEVARTLTERAAPAPQPRSSPFLATTDGKLVARKVPLRDNIID